jgi:hypothetical protein
MNKSFPTDFKDEQKENQKNDENEKFYSLFGSTSLFPSFEDLMKDDDSDEIKNVEEIFKKEAFVAVKSDNSLKTFSEVVIKKPSLYARLLGIVEPKDRPKIFTIDQSDNSDSDFSEFKKFAKPKKESIIQKSSQKSNIKASSNPPTTSIKREEVQASNSFLLDIRSKSVEESINETQKTEHKHYKSKKWHKEQKKLRKMNESGTSQDLSQSILPTSALSREVEDNLVKSETFEESNDIELISTPSKRSLKKLALKTKPLKAVKKHPVVSSDAAEIIVSNTISEETEVEYDPSIDIIIIQKIDPISKDEWNQIKKFEHISAFRYEKFLNYKEFNDGLSSILSKFK